MWHLLPIKPAEASYHSIAVQDGRSLQTPWQADRDALPAGAALACTSTPDESRQYPSNRTYPAINWTLAVGFGLDTVITELAFSVAAVEVSSGVAVVGAVFEVSTAGGVVGMAVSDCVGWTGVVVASATAMVVVTALLHLGL